MSLPSLFSFVLSMNGLSEYLGNEMEITETLVFLSPAFPVKINLRVRVFLNCPYMEP